MELIEGMNRRYVRVCIREDMSGGMEGYRSRIILKNKIAAFVKADKRYIDGVRYFYYDITGLHNLKQIVLAGSVTIEKMNGFVDSLENIMHRMEEFLLLQKELCLHPEHVYYDEKSEGWMYLYVPDYAGNQAEDIDCLLEVIMDRVECACEDDLERFYSFYNEVLQNMEEITLAGIVRLWDKGELKAEKKKMCIKEEVQVITDRIEMQERSMPVWNEKTLCRKKIYTVPYHGIKVSS